MSNYRMLDGQPDGHPRLEPTATGPALLNDPLLNRDTAFTSEEREALASSACCRPPSPPWTSR